MLFKSILKTFSVTQTAKSIITLIIIRFFTTGGVPPKLGLSNALIKEKLMDVLFFE